MNNRRVTEATYMSYKRARQRALGRLANYFPTTFSEIMEEELAKEPDYRPSRKSKYVTS